MESRRARRLMRTCQPGVAARGAQSGICNELLSAVRAAVPPPLVVIP
jgi:hypothetical protein